MTNTVLIIDFGSQVTQLIARRVREAGVYSEIVPFNHTDGAFERLQPKAVILSGGPASVTEMGTPRAPEWVWTSGLPVLGICYGEQTMVSQLGGGVEAQLLWCHGVGLRCDEPQFPHAVLLRQASPLRREPLGVR